MMLAIRLLLALAILAVVVRLLKRRQGPAASSPAASSPAGSSPAGSRSPESGSSADPSDLWSSMHAHFEQQDRELEQARHWSDGEIRLAVEQYVFKLPHSDDDVDDWFPRLRQQPGKAAKEALRQATDPDLQSRLRKEPKGQPALYRACQLMMLAPEAGAEPQIERLLAAQTREVRHDALRWLAQLGSPASQPRLVEALRGEDRAACHAVLRGVLEGVHDPNGEFARDMFEPLAAAMQRFCDARDRQLAAQLLLRWNADQARQEFELAGWLRWDHASFAPTLDAMRSEGHLLARSHLLALWRQLDGDGAAGGDSTSRDIGSRDIGSGDGDTGSGGDAATAILGMLASHRDDADLDLLHEVLARPHAVAGAAAEALLDFHRIANWRTAHRDGDNRPAEADAALALLSYDGNVSSGGHGSFFRHASGDAWRTALAALETAQDIPRREILREALARFPEPPSTDRKTRQAQLANLTRGDDSVFDDLDARYGAVEVPIEVAVTKLVLQDPDAFGARG